MIIRMTFSKRMTFHCTRACTVGASTVSTGEYLFFSRVQLKFEKLTFHSTWVQTLSSYLSHKKCSKLIEKRRNLPQNIHYYYKITILLWLFFATIWVILFTCSIQNLFESLLSFFWRIVILVPLPSKIIENWPRFIQDVTSCIKMRQLMWYKSYQNGTIDVTNYCISKWNYQ